MNDSIWQTIAETSVWAYIAIGYVIYLGYRTSKQRTIPVQQLWLSMTSIISLSIVSILYFVTLNLTTIAWWVSMLLLGSGLGWLHYNRLQVLHIAAEKKLLIPGSWLTMCIIYAVMAAPYYFGYRISLDTNMLKSGQYSQTLMIMYGLMTGLCLGRLVYTRRVITSASPMH